MIRNATDPILKFNETVISIADETIQRPRQIQNIQVNHGLMMNAKMTSKIAKKVEQRFEKHPTSDNLDNFRIFRVKARRTVKQKLNNYKTNLQHVKDGQDTSEKGSQINVAKHFQKNSSTQNFHPQFQKNLKQKLI